MFLLTVRPHKIRPSETLSLSLQYHSDNLSFTFIPDDPINLKCNYHFNGKIASGHCFGRTAWGHCEFTWNEDMVKISLMRAFDGEECSVAFTVLLVGESKTSFKKAIDFWNGTVRKFKATGEY